MPTIECPACQASATIPDEFLGRKIKCRACQEVFVATLPKPTAKEEPVAAKPRPPKRPADDVDDVDAVKEEKRPAKRRDDDDDEDERPAKAKKGPPAPAKVGPMVYALMAVVGFGLLGGGGVLTYFAAISESKPTMRGDGTIPPPPSGLGGNKGMGGGGGPPPAPPPPPRPPK